MLGVWAYILGVCLDELVEQIALRGYAFLPRHKPGVPSVKVFQSFGSVLTLDQFAPVQSLKPHNQTEATPNTYSGNFGTNEFPLHTDLAIWALPPHYISLRCIYGTKSVATRLLDGRTIIESLGSNLLRRTLVQPRRPLRNGKQIMRLLEFDNTSGEPRIRWDCLFLKSATDGSKTAMSKVRECLAQLPNFDLHLVNPGDTLIIDNWRMLHGRARTPEYAMNRQIDRAYIGDLF